LRHGGLKSKDVKNFREMFEFLKKDPLTVKFSKFCSKSIHRDKFRKFGRREIGEIVRYSPDKKTSPCSPAVAAALIAPKICRGQPMTM